MFLRFAVVLIIFSLGGCAGRTALGGDPGIRVLAGSELPAPEPIDTAAQARPYRIGPFDKLLIDVFGIEDLSGRELQVDAAGHISFPLVGTIDAAGKTPGEVAATLEQELRTRFVKNPQVTVNLKEIVSQVVTIDGEVREPGLYPVVGRMTLMRAVATSKGLTEYAKLDDVVVFRTVGNQRLAALYNMGAIRKGAYADPDIFAGDVIVVGDSSARRLFRNVLQIVPLFTTPLIVALQRF